MSIRAIRTAVFLFFIAYAVAVTWPAALLFSGPTPFVFGLPFSMAWAVLWIVMGGCALWILHRAVERAEADDAAAAEPAAGGPEAD